MDADEAITRVASILTPDSKQEDYREGDPFPLLGASEELLVELEPDLLRALHLHEEVGGLAQNVKSLQLHEDLLF
jgi:hypothetical protein